MFKEVGWRSDLDEELRRFFAGDFVGDAGLVSKFGSQLDKVRDGVNYKGGSAAMTFLGADAHGPSMWTRSDLPARCVEFGRSGLGVNRVMHAFRAMQETAVRVAVEAERAKFAKSFKAKNDRDPTTEELGAFMPKPEPIQEAIERARRHITVLEAFYTPTPPGSMWGLLGLGQHAMVATMTKPVMDAARGWLAEQRDAELARYCAAVTRSKDEAQKRLGAWENWRTELVHKQDDIARELASHADETGAVKRVSIARRGYLLRRQVAIPEADAEIATYLARVRGERIPAIDTERMIRRKWDRGPTSDELKDALRRICETARSKSPELRAAAERQKNEAELAAKRELGAARAAYAAERGGKRDPAGDKPVKKAPGALSRKRQAVIDDFEAEVGIR